MTQKNRRPLLKEPKKPALLFRMIRAPFDEPQRPEADAFDRNPLNPVRGFGALNQDRFAQGLER